MRVSPHRNLRLQGLRSHQPTSAFPPDEAPTLRQAEMDVSLSQKVMLFFGGGAGLVFNPSALSPILWAGVKWQYNAVWSLTAQH